MVGALPSWPSHFPKSSPPNIITLGIRFSTWIFRGHKHLDHSTCLHEMGCFLVIWYFRCHPFYPKCMQATLNTQSWWPFLRHDLISGRRKSGGHSVGANPSIQGEIFYSWYHLEWATLGFCYHSWILSDNAPLLLPEPGASGSCHPTLDMPLYPILVPESLFWEK